MSQNYQQDERKNQISINFDDRRKKPYDYVKKWSPSGQQVGISVITALIIGLISFIGGNYLTLNRTVNNHTIVIEKMLTASPVDQPQVVVNEEIKGDIQLLADQVGNMVSEFSEFKREQKSTDNDFEGDLESMDETLESMDDNLLEIKIKLGIH